MIDITYIFNREVGFYHVIYMMARIRRVGTLNASIDKSRMNYRALSERFDESSMQALT